MGYIYIFTNKKNKKQYVGMTTRPIEDRLADYKYSKEKRPIVSALKRYGWLEFDLKYFECDNDKLLDVEEEYIKKLNTLVPNGYNIIERGRMPNREYLSKIQKQRWNFIKIGYPEWVKERNKQYDNSSDYELTSEQSVEFIRIYDFIERECCRWAKYDSGFHQELVLDALDFARWLIGKGHNSEEIKINIQESIHSNYIRKRNNEPLSNTVYQYNEDGIYVGDDDYNCGLNDVNWYYRKDLAKKNKTCKIHKEELNTEKVIDCKSCGFKRYWVDIDSEYIKSLKNKVKIKRESNWRN